MSSRSIPVASVSMSAPQTALEALFTFLGRALLTVVFFVYAPKHFGATDLGYAIAAGVPFARFLVPASGILALVGSVSVLVGYQTKLGAWLLVLFLLPVTLTMHKFWGLTDPMLAQLQMANFMRNISIIGGALLLAQFGPGAWSLDARTRR